MVNVLYPGLQVILEVENPATKKKEKHRCRVADLESGKVFIDYPINVKTNLTVSLRNDTNVIVRFVEPVSFSAIRIFETKVIGHLNKVIPMLVLHDPGPEAYQRLQRRSFVRIQAAVDVIVEFEGCKEIPAVTADISAGGMLAVLSSYIKTQTSSGVANIHVTTKQEGSQWIAVPVKLLRMNKNDRTDEYSASFQFTEMDVHTEKLLTRFCFERQLDQRKKGLERIRT